MLFKHTFHAGIRDGSITRTYRVWDKPRAKAGGTHRLGAAGAIEIRTVEPVTLGSITTSQARRAGFADTDELYAMLRAASGKRLTTRSRIYCVTFRFAATEDPRKALQRDTSKAAVADVLVRLARMDKASRRGPWTHAVLAVIAQRPRTRAPDLAEHFGLETQPFKRDVRKLKALGLTISHKVGYELSPRGKAVLRHLRMGGA